MKEIKTPVVSFIKGENIRPKADFNLVQSEMSVGERSYYANQKVFSAFVVEDLPLAVFS